MGEKPGAICGNALDLLPTQKHVGRLMVEQVEIFGIPADGWSGWDRAAYVCNQKNDDQGFEKCYTCDATTKRCVSKFSDISTCAGFRLPSEIEWEYLYKAGTTTQLFDGTDLTSCQASKSGFPDPAVDENRWGLIGMHATPEWVNDWFVHDITGITQEHMVKGIGVRAAWRGHPKLSLEYSPAVIAGGNIRCVINSVW